MTIVFAEELINDFKAFEGAAFMISRGRSWLDHPFLCTKYREGEFYRRRRGAVSSASRCLKHGSQ